MSVWKKADVVIVGGGIIGVTIARELSKYSLDVILLEKETDIAIGTTKANSGIVHAGFDAHQGTMKALMNVRGNEIYHALNKELALGIKFIGSLVVATNQAEMDTVQELLQRGQANGVPGLTVIDKAELLKREPNLSPDVVGALWAPTAGVIIPFEAAAAFAENAVRNGVEIIRECQVENIIVKDNHIEAVKTSLGTISTSYVINAAGLFADAISKMAGDESFTITPRKGEYILFDKKQELVNSIVFPAPSKVSKGILVSPTAHGNIFVGPNAQEVTDKDDLATTPAGMDEILKGAAKLVPNIPVRAAITGFAGLRAASSTGDFVLGASKVTKGLIQAGGIQSPGLTSAPAIAEYLVEELRKAGLTLAEKHNFMPQNPPLTTMRSLSNKEKAAAIAKNPLYGRIICRCESISEGEIVDAINRPCGALTVDAVKRRTRAGMGRCQGGFCGPRVTTILARELNIPITEVRKDTKASYLYYDKLATDEVTQKC
jgi:glycerol-3-phosphate dehydrogenase